MLSVLMAAATLPAADLYWSGTGTWDTTAQNWGTSSGGPYDAAVWNNTTPDAATFQGTAGTVTVDAGGVNAADLTFSTTGYTVTGGTITLSGTPAMTFANVAATLNSRIQLDADADLTITNASGTRLVALGGGIAGTNRNLTIDVTGSNANFSGIQPTADWDFTGSVTVNRSAASGYSAIFANQASGQNALRGADVTLNDALLFMGNGSSGMQVQLRTLAGNAGADVRSDNQSSVLVLGTDDGSSNTTTYSGLLRNGGGAAARVAITKNGTYTQVFSGAGITYTGATTINAGTVRLTDTTAFASAVAFANAAGATLDLGSALTLPGLSGGGTTGGTVALGSNTLTVSKASGTDTFGGVMSGTGSLVKAGAGGLTLSGANSFTGDVTVSAGTLTVNRAANTATPTATALGDMSVARTVTIEAGATLAITQNDALGDTASSQPVAFVVDGGTLSHGNKFVTIGPIELRNGGSLTGGNGANAGFQAFNFNGDITVSGNAPALLTTTGTTNTASHLNKAGGVTFDVADVTGDGNVDFTVATGLLNRAPNIGGAGSLIKTGSGTMAMTSSSSYSGGTAVNAGTILAGSSAALGSGAVSIAAGGRLELAADSVIANAITDLGTGSFLGTLDFAGGGLARTSTAGGGTLGTLLAGSAGSAASLNPAIAWVAQTSDTASDIMQLTNTSGTAQVLSLTYDPSFAPAAPQDAFLGWLDGSNDWVNAIDGNSGGTGSFFQGSWTDFLAANPLATPTTALGTYGHDSATNSVWAVVNHNSDFAVIVVPEPAALPVAGLAAAAALGLARRHWFRRQVS